MQIIAWLPLSLLWLLVIVQYLLFDAVGYINLAPATGYSYKLHLDFYIQYLSSHHNIFHTSTDNPLQCRYINSFSLVSLGNGGELPFCSELVANAVNDLLILGPALVFRHLVGM